MISRKGFFLKGVLLCALFILYILVNTSYSQDSSSDDSTTNENSVVITVDWGEGRSIYRHTELSSSDVKLEIIVKHLNLFKYDITAHSSARILTRTQELPDYLQFMNGRLDDRLVDKSGNVPITINRINNNINTRILNWNNISLSNPYYHDIEEDFESISNDDANNVPYFLLKDKFEAFKLIANTIINGKLFVIATISPGMEYAVVLRASKKNIIDDNNAVQDEEKRIVFAVASGSRFDLHAGFSVSKLSRVEFKEIERDKNGEKVSLFNLITDEDWKPLLAGFMSYEICNFYDDKYGILATIGTDMNDPLNKIYLGGSIRIGDLFIYYSRRSCSKN